MKRPRAKQRERAVVAIPEPIVTPGESDADRKDHHVSTWTIEVPGVEGRALLVHRHDEQSRTALRFDEQHGRAVVAWYSATGPFPIMHIVDRDFHRAVRAVATKLVRSRTKQ